MMLTGNRYWTLIVVLGLCILATAGCRRKRSDGSTVVGDPFFDTDDFPGGAVEDNNVADDQRALSESGMDIGNSTVRVFFNGSRDIAMVVYTTGFGFAGGGDNAVVHYYDGTFRPGVSITNAVDMVDVGHFNPGFGSWEISTGDVSVAWINTDGNASTAAQARDGDAIIHWPGRDFASGGTDGNNDSLYSTYFRAEFADDPIHFTATGNEYRRGFQRYGFRVDVDDEAGENVTTIGLLSDGLCGEARWQPFASDYHWGDATTQIIVFWNQLINNTAAFDPTTLWSRYPLDQAGASEDPLIPTFPNDVDILTFGASDTGVNSHETLCDTQYISYNLTVFQRVIANNGAFPGGFTNFPGGYGADNDITIQTSTFSATDFFTTDHLQTFTPDATDNDENGADFISQNFGFIGGHSTFGPDEGILEIVQFHTQLVEEPTGSYFGTATNSGDLIVSQIDPATGQDIGDAFLDIEDVTLFSDGPSPFETDMRMSRNGDYIDIAWREVSSAGATDDLALMINHYRTSRDPILGILPIASATTGASQANGDIDGEPVSWFAFQQQLGYICGIQSDAEVMNIFYEQSDGSFDEVNVVRITADVVVGTASATFTDSIVITDDDNGVLGGGVIGSSQFIGVDSGENGNFFASFFRDIDTATFTDVQLFSIRTGASGSSGRIDSGFNFRTPFNLEIAATPTSEDHSDDPTDSGSRDRGAEIIHSIFDESSSQETFGASAIRTRAFYTDTGSGITFVDAFTPDLLDFPFTLSLIQDDPGGFGSPFRLNTAAEGNELCFYFSQFAHIYYQEFSGGGGSSGNNVEWRTTDGGDSGSGTFNDAYTSPALVDDDDPNAANTQLFFGHSCVCDECDGMMIFWKKSVFGTSSSTDERWQVRVHDGQ